MDIHIIDAAQMPQTVAIESKVTAARQEIESALNAANKAVTRLLESGEIQLPTTADINDWQGLFDAVNERKEQAVSAVYRNKLLNYYQKKKTVKEWQKWASDTTATVNHLVIFLSNYPTAKLTADGLFTIADINQLATRQAQQAVPTEAATHATHIAAVATAIAELRKWEASRKTKKIPLERLISYTNEQLATIWASGDIFRQIPTTPLMRQIMEEAAAKEPFYL